MTYKTEQITNSFLKLKAYCEKEAFSGWDPYDGLSSKIFGSTPLNSWSITRLAWIQFFKRSPVNLRKLLAVPKEHNPKALGLFLTAYANLYKIAEDGDTTFGTKEEIVDKIELLADMLIDLKAEGYSGTCWGYNFDWQARGGLYFKAYTPTVVATTFAAYGLLDAYEVVGNEKFKQVSVSTARFLLDDLNRTSKEEGFLFSYAPEFGNNTVYNASLLGSKLLARIHSVNPKDEYFNAAKDSVLACCNAQNEDGSWYYGELPFQNWIDSFHTGFNLEAIYDYQRYTGDKRFQKHIEKGFHYYIQNFFLEGGIPKYYHNKTYPIDIHCPAEFITTLSRTGRFQQHKDLAEKVLNWTVGHMQDERGFFYYQKNKSLTNKIPYMRWSQSWMFAAFSYFLKETKTEQ
jgi:rhamnogalacturonyl hydrolase YesR